MAIIDFDRMISMEARAVAVGPRPENEDDDEVILMHPVWAADIMNNWEVQKDLEDGFYRIRASLAEVQDYLKDRPIVYVTGSR